MEIEMKHSKFKRICVFCGSSPGKKSSYKDAAIELGKELVIRETIFCLCFLLFLKFSSSFLPNLLSFFLVLLDLFLSVTTTCLLFWFSILIPLLWLSGLNHFLLL